MNFSTDGETRLDWNKYGNAAAFANPHGETGSICSKKVILTIPRYTS